MSQIALSRRQALLAAPVLLSAPAIAQAQPRAIKLGIIQPVTGAPDPAVGHGPIGTAPASSVSHAGRRHHATGSLCIVLLFVLSRPHYSTSRGSVG